MARRESVRLTNICMLQERRVVSEQRIQVLLKRKVKLERKMRNVFSVFNFKLN